MIRAGLRCREPSARRVHALRGKLVRGLAHDAPTYLGVGAYEKFGAVQMDGGDEGLRTPVVSCRNVPPIQ